MPELEPERAAESVLELAPEQGPVRGSGQGQEPVRAQEPELEDSRPAPEHGSPSARRGYSSVDWRLDKFRSSDPSGFSRACWPRPASLRRLRSKPWKLSESLEVLSGMDASFLHPKVPPALRTNLPYPYSEGIERDLRRIQAAKLSAHNGLCWSLGFRSWPDRPLDQMRALLELQSPLSDF